MIPLEMDDMKKLELLTYLLFLVFILSALLILRWVIRSENKEQAQRQERTQADLGRDGSRELLRTRARDLERKGEFDEALNLYREIGSLEDVARLEEYLGHGSAETET
jgi:hypothetical protein